MTISSDRDMIIRTVLAEAGPNASPVEQAAVAHVILNRQSLGSAGGYRSTIPGVIMQRNAFEPWSLSKDNPNHPMRFDPNSPGYQSVSKVVDGVLSGATPDPTGGMTRFLQPDIMASRVKNGTGTMPSWASGSGLRIGQHSFYPEPGNAATAAPAAARGTPESDADLLSRYGGSQPPTKQADTPASPPPASAEEKDADLLKRYTKPAEPDQAPQDRVQSGFEDLAAGGIPAKGVPTAQNAWNLIKQFATQHPYATAALGGSMGAAVTGPARIATAGDAVLSGISAAPGAAWSAVKAAPAAAWHLGKIVAPYAGMTEAMRGGEDVMSLLRRVMP